MILDVNDLEVLAWMVMGDSEEDAVMRINARYDRDAEFKWDLDGSLEKRFGCDFQGFTKLIEALLPMTPLAESMLTGERYHAFLNQESESIIKIKEGDL